MFVNKDKKSNQVCYDDWVIWCNEKIPGTSFAERLEQLCQNWIQTKDKSYAEMFIDEKILHKKIDDYLKEKEEQDGR